MLGQQNNVARLQRAMSMILSNDWPPCTVDFEQDSETFMKVAEEKEKDEYEEKKNRIPVD